MQCRQHHVPAVLERDGVGDGGRDADGDGASVDMGVCWRYDAGDAARMGIGMEMGMALALGMVSAVETVLTLEMEMVVRMEMPHA